MEDTFTCPACDNENAYFAGLSYVCPDCDYEWPVNGITDDDDSEDNDSYKETYKILIKLPEPIFKLAHGQLYSCKKKSEEGEVEETIIPLAFENGKNRLFVLWNAGHVPAKYPDFIASVTNKDFRTIKREGDEYGEYPSSYKAQPILCTTDKYGSLINQFGELYYDFKMMR